MRKRLSLTETGEGVVEPRHLLSLIQDTMINAHAMGDAGCPMFSYLCGAINALGALGYVEVREPAPPPVGAGPDPKGSDPPPFFLDAYQDKEKKGGDDAAGESVG